jgi:hypothetical protein
MDKEEGLCATGSLQGVMRGSQERPTNPHTGVSWVNKQEEQVAIVRVRGRIPHHSTRLVGGDEQHARRHVIGHEVYPVLRREHGFVDEIAQVAPASTHGCVEHGSDGRGVARNPHVAP